MKIILDKTIIFDIIFYITLAHSWLAQTLKTWPVWARTRPMPSTQPPGMFQPFMVRVMPSREKATLPDGTTGGTAVWGSSWISRRLALILRNRADVKTEM